MANQKVIAVIGLGSIGKRHAKNLSDMGHRVVGYDPVEAVAWAPHYPIYADAIVASDAVVVASPTSCHLDHVVRALPRPVFVEKPIADSPGAGLLYSIATPSFMVGYNLRFHSCVKKAKDWLDAGLIGRPLWANFCCAQYNDRPTYLRDGVVLNWSHEIDLALYLLSYATVAASSTRLNADGQDVMTDILLTHHDDTRTSIHLDYNTRPEQRDFKIVGTDGSIDANLVERMVTLKPNGKYYNTVVGTDSYDENYIEEMQAFIDRIDGKPTIGCNKEEALRVLEICLEVRKQAGLR